MGRCCAVQTFAKLCFDPLLGLHCSLWIDAASWKGSLDLLRMAFHHQGRWVNFMWLSASVFLSGCFGFDLALMFLNHNHYKRSLSPPKTSALLDTQESTQLFVPWKAEQDGSDSHPCPVPAGMTCAFWGSAGTTVYLKPVPLHSWANTPNFLTPMPLSSKPWSTLPWPSTTNLTLR